MPNISSCPNLRCSIGIYEPLTKINANKPQYLQKRAWATSKRLNNDMIKIAILLERSFFW